MTSLGTDPEFFLEDSRTGETMPVCGLFGGTKGEPKPFEAALRGYGYQEDNVMLELNTPPVNSVTSFCFAVETVLQHASALINQYNERNGTSLSVFRGCSRLLSDDKLTHPQAKQFGCAPSFGAYTNGSPLPPVDVTLLRDGGGEWRFAGGHVHIGLNAASHVGGEIPDFVLAAFADAFIGLPMAGYDRQGNRRRFYGQAGSYRPTAYGIEYRVLSNLWLFSPDLIHMVANQATKLADFVEQHPIGAIHKLYATFPWTAVQEAINTEDVDAANTLFVQLEREVRI